MRQLDRHFAGKKHVIFDWNGTLLNDIDVCVEVISAMLTDHQLPALSREKYRQIFRFPVRQYYLDIGFDYSKIPFEVLAEEFVRRYKDRAWDCLLFDGATELLETLRQQAKGTSLLSAAHEGHLKELLAHHEIEHLFDHIYALPDNYAASKIDRGRELISAIGLPVGDIIMIGDTDHDIEVAEALGIELLLLADGHQDEARLRPLHANLVSQR